MAERQVYFHPRACGKVHLLERLMKGKKWAIMLPRKHGRTFHPIRDALNRDWAWKQLKSRQEWKCVRLEWKGED